MLLCAVGAVALAGAELELDEALALIPEHDVMISYDTEGRAQLEATIGVFRSALGVTAALDELDERAVNRFPVDPELRHVVNKLSQSYYTLADAFLEQGSEAARQAYLKGKHWGLKSLRMNPEFAALEGRNFATAVNTISDVSALYWANANWLRAAEFSPMVAFVAGVTWRTETLMLRIREVDPSYVSYGVYRSLGAYWSGLPVGRDLNRALEYLCHVVDEPELCAHGPIDPDVDEYFENRLFFAEFYLMEAEKWEDARRVLQSILDEPIGDKYPLYNALVHERAAQLLEEIEQR